MTRRISRRPSVFAFAIGITLALPGILTASADASAGALASHKLRAARRHKSAAHVPTVLSVSTGAASTSRVPRQPASGGVAPASAAVTCRNTGLVPSASNLDLVDAATLCLVNKARQAGDLAPLTESTRLDQAAVAHSDEMVADDYFDHVAPDGTGPAQRVLATGYSPGAPGGEIAENISAATRSEATPAATVAMWLGSAGHRANILNPDFTHTGIGATNAVPRLLGAAAGGTYTEDFA